MKRINKLIYSALFIALTFVVTYFIKIPIPATDGYIHPGDGIILASAFLFGPYMGGIIGAFGSALSDLVGGYAVYILPTFVIKGLMGYTAGRMIKNPFELSVKNILSYVLLFFILVGGYYITEVILYGSFVTPLISALFNIIQYVSGVVIGLVLYKLLKR